MAENTKNSQPIANNQLQQTLFQQIKSVLPPHLSIVDAVADLLMLSTDSAYRRIRGEKPLSLEETQKLCATFKISLDALLHLQTDSFIFSGKLADSQNFVFEKWMEAVLQQVQFMSSFPQKQMYYVAKDVPLMQQFLIPELIAFKSFLWRKSILHYDEMKGIQFSINDINPEHLQLANKIVEAYNAVSSTDIWNIESINSTITQIEFYRDSGFFATPDDVLHLYKVVIDLIDHLEKQAESGTKFCVGGKPLQNAGSYHLFNNELVLGHNTILAVLGSTKVTYLNHSTINFISTTDERFNNYMFDAIQNLIKKSMQLSVVGEKERVKFFNCIREKLKKAARF